MIKPQPDHRSPSRRARDEKIAAEPALKAPELTTDVRAVPLEAHLIGRRHPIAVAGIVENGVVRTLDPSVKLPERARVIIVASEET